MRTCTIINNAIINLFLRVHLQTGVFISVHLFKGCAACVGPKDAPLFVGQCTKWNELAWLPYESTQGEGPATGVLCSVQTSPRTQRVRTQKLISSFFILVRISKLQIITFPLKKNLLASCKLLCICISLFIKRQVRKIK